MGYIAKGSITLDTVNDAYTVSLSKQSCVIHADFDGSNPQLSEAHTTVTVLRGDKVMAFDCAPVVDDGSNINFTIENTNRTSYRIVLTSIPTNSLEGTLQFRITTDDGYATTIQFSYTVVRESTMLDWIQDWEGGKTKIGGTYIMTPKIFIGKKDEYAEYGEGGTNPKDSIMSVPGLTGVYIGPDTESTGIYGYLNSEEIFHLNGTGGMIGGWVIDSYGIRSKNGHLQILSGGEIRAINDEGDSVWRITENGEASFAMENVRFFANGDAEFTGKITSKEGQIGGWTIEEGRLYNTPIGISASGKYIAIANVESIPVDSEWGDNHFGWMRGYGGAALYYSSRNTFGFIAYGTGGDNMVFAAGSTNYIAGWNFDNEAIWSGTKNNTTSGYSTDGITIGSTGLRGIKWYIDSSGDVSFMGGKITFSAADNGGEIVGWKLNERRLSTDKVALISDDTSVGLYMSAATNAKFNTFASSSLEDFIDSWGGIYMKVKPDSADFAAYNSEGTRLFKIKSGGISYIAGWRFDAETLYTGEAVTSGYTSSGQITLGPTGLRGYKWRFENDGSGAVAGGNISWDSNGNVTFAESVKLAWGQCVDADGNSISNYLTKIDANGIYTGSISADNITSGTISTADITSSDDSWALNQDGTGWLAKKNISWGKDGSLSITGEINATSGTIGGFTIGSNSITSSGSATLKIGNTAFNVVMGTQSYTKSVQMNGGINSVVITNYDMDYKVNNVVTMQKTNSSYYNWQKIGIANVMDIAYHTGMYSTSQSPNMYGLQYAMLGTGHVIMDAIVEGGCFNVLNNWTANYQWQFLQLPMYGNRIVVYNNTYDHCGLVLPDKYSIFTSLGCNVINNLAQRAFTFRVDIINTGTKAIAIAGRNSGKIGNFSCDNEALPYLRVNGAEYNSSLEQVKLYGNRIMSLMLVFDGVTYMAFIINSQHST